MERWLHSRIEWKGEQIKRGQIYKIFLHDGLLPLIEDMGYSVGTPLKKLYGYMVSGIYNSRERPSISSQWNMTHYTRRWAQEEKIHFYHIMNPDVWERFWNDWGEIEDFSEYSFRGRDRRTDIEDFIWRQIDLDISYQSEILYELMNDEYELESEETQQHPKKVDVYLVETSGWGGLRR